MKPKRILTIVLLTCLCALCLVVFVGCQKQHKHIFFAGYCYVCKVHKSAKDLDYTINVPEEMNRSIIKTIPIAPMIMGIRLLMANLEKVYLYPVTVKHF